MQLYLILIDPIDTTNVSVTPHPLGEFPWMEESELRRFLDQCPWHVVPASQYPETELAEGVWESMKEFLTFKSITYLKYEDEIQAHIDQLQDEHSQGIADHDLRILVVGEKPEPPRIEYNHDNRPLEI
jgi:hypothetical protein